MDPETFQKALNLKIEKNIKAVKNNTFESHQKAISMRFLFLKKKPLKRPCLITTIKIFLYKYAILNEKYSPIHKIRTST